MEVGVTMENFRTPGSRRYMIENPKAVSPYPNSDISQKLPYSDIVGWIPQFENRK